MSAFDYVVVGGGTAGAVVAARLSEDPSVTVCVLEAGPSDVGDPAILRLEDWMGLLESAYDWDYPVEPQATGNSFLRHARARVLGGCSSHNSCIAFRPPAEDLDEWAALGCEGWSAEECAPSVERLAVTLTPIEPRDPCGVALLEACELTGIPRASFNQGRTVVDGAGFFDVNATADNVRSSASVAYLHPVMGVRPNLEVRTGARAKRLHFDAARRCHAVELMTDDLFTTERVEAREEVILSAGAIDSPKLLMLSGIGPADHLREVGVEVLVDAPGVGSTLQDHPEGLVMWDAAQPMVATSTQWWEIGIFAATEPGLDRPDLMFHYGSVPFDLNTVRHGYPTTENGFCLTPNVTRSRSVGTVRLRSRDVRDRPRVDPRYFSHPHDERVMLHGIRLARDIVSKAPMTPWAGAELAPGPEAQSDDELLDYVHKTHNTVYHPSCTVPMGAADDVATPLDPRLRVQGVEGLRVVDGSVMPFLTAVNPCITTMVIGERAAELIREDAR